MKNISITTVLCFTINLIFSQNSDSSKFYFQKGVQERDARRFAVASKNFDKAIQFDQNFAEAYIENAKAGVEMRKPDQALVNYAKAYQLQPSNREVMKELCLLYFNNRQFQQAMELAQKCSCPDADRIMGMGFYQQEDYGKAAAYLKKTVAVNDSDAEAEYILGRTYIELENEKAAIPQYLKAIAINPSQSSWIYELALIYYSKDDYKNALKYFNKSADAGYARSNDFYENVGFAQIYTGDAANGIKTLQIVLDRKPGNKELLNNIANAMYETRRYDDALNYFSKLLELDPKDASSLFMAGMVFQKKGEKEKGQKICDKAIEMDPSLAKNRQKKDISMGL